MNWLKRLGKSIKKTFNKTKETVSEWFNGEVEINNKIRGWDYDFKVTKKELRQYKKEVKKLEKKRKKIKKSVDKHLDTEVEKIEKILSETRPHQKVNVIRFLPAKAIPVNKLTSRESFERQLKRLKEHNTPTFFEDRANTYRDNLITAIRDRYNSDGDELVSKIRELTPEQVQWLLLRHPNDFSIPYVYEHDPDKTQLVMKQLIKFVDEAKTKNIKIGV